MAPQPPDQVSWGDRSGKVVSAGKHGVVVGANGSKHKLFWDEVESVKKPGKDGESTGKAEPEKAPWKPIEPGMVEPTEAHKTLEAAGWKATTKGITTNWHVIGLSDEAAWAHNRFNVK